MKQAGGAAERWDKLEEVWTLIGDEPRFSAYVEEHARAYLSES